MNPSVLVALDLPTVLAAVVVTTQPLKALLEVFCPPSNRAHDALVQCLAITVGIVWAILLIWAEEPVSRSITLEIIISVLLGVGGGSAGVGAWHIAHAATSKTPKEPPSS